MYLEFSGEAGGLPLPDGRVGLEGVVAPLLLRAGDCGSRRHAYRT